MRILHVVGARPNFMKTAPVMAEMARRPDLFQQVLVHTGQHYDFGMSQVFFGDLGLPEPDESLGVGSGGYVLATLHRPANVDDPTVLREIIAALKAVARDWPVVFPVHPRTRKNLAALDLPLDPNQVRLLEPLSYLDFLALLHAAK